MKNLLLALSILFFLIVGCSSDDKNNNSTSSKNKSMEEMIVTVDGKTPGDNDIDVKRVRYLLDNLASRTITSRNDIGETANKSVQIIENNIGRRYTRQQFLEASVEFMDQWEKREKAKKSKYEKPDFGLVSATIIISAK